MSLSKNHILDRDVKTLSVWKDIETKVIFIDDFYVGDK